jgi:hypothetical protein
MRNFCYQFFLRHPPTNHMYAYMGTNVPAKLMHIKHKILFTLGNCMAVLWYNKKENNTTTRTTKNRHNFA